MKKSIRMIAAIFLLMLTVIFIYNIIQASEENKSASYGESLEVGKPAPDFQLSTLDGEIIQLSDYRGKKVFLNFWATWCGPCEEEMPALEEFYRNNKEEVVVLSVNALNTELDGRKKVRTFIEEYQLSFPVVLDEKGEIAEIYRVTHMPTTVFIGTDGVIQEEIHRGAIDEDSLLNLKNKLN